MADQTPVPIPKRREIKDLLTGSEFMGAVKAALPKHLSAERFIRVAITALTRTPKLQQCTQESFFKCLLDLSAVGLEPDGRRAHLIPFNDFKNKTVLCTLILDYKGIVELVRRSGEVSYIHCDIVYEGDEFSYEYGSKAHLHHVPKLDAERKPSQRKAVYSFVKMRDGSEDFMVWGMSRVEAIRQRSKSKDDGPWQTDYDEMGKKSVFRNHSKWLPLSAELRDHIELDDDAIHLSPDSFQVIEEAGTREDQGLVAVGKLLAGGKIEDARGAARKFGVTSDAWDQLVAEHYKESSTNTTTVDDRKEGDKPERPAQTEAATDQPPISAAGSTAPSPETPQSYTDDQLKAMPPYQSSVAQYLNSIGRERYLRTMGANGLEDVSQVTETNWHSVAREMDDILKALRNEPERAAQTAPEPIKTVGKQQGKLKL